MTADVQPVPRIRPPDAGDERETLTGLLDFLHATVVNKVAGLTDEQAFSAPVPPSTLTPAGVVKHLAGTERSGSASTSPPRTCRGRGRKTIHMGISR
jgi:hypothetical protein